MRRQEQEIFIGDVFWKIIFGWRKIVILAIIFALLLPAFMYAKNGRDASEETQTAEPSITEAEAEAIAAYREAVSSGEEYLNDSLYMRINPYEVHVLTMKYYVDSKYTFNYTEENELNYTQSVIAAYCEYADEGSMAGTIAEELGGDIEEKYIYELIETNTVSDGSGVFVISVKYPTADDLEMISEIIEETLNGKKDEIEKSIGTHELTLISNDITVETDLSLATTQQNTRKDFTNYKNILTELESGLSAADLQYVDTVHLENDGETMADSASAINVYGLKYYLKNAIIGAVIGIVLAIMWLAIRILLTGKVRSSRELSRAFEVPFLGIIGYAGIKNPIDKLLTKIKNRRRQDMSLEESMELIVSNIELLCKSENVKKIYITGTETDNIKDSIEKMIELLKKSGIEAACGNDVCYDAASLLKMADAGNVVVIEQAGVSNYTDIENELTKIEEQKARVIGMVSFDAIYN